MSFFDSSTKHLLETDSLSAKLNLVTDVFFRSASLVFYWNYRPNSLDSGNLAGSPI